MIPRIALAALALLLLYAAAHPEARPWWVLAALAIICIAAVRMSPQHAFVLTQVMRKNMREYEAKVGKIELPEGMYKDLGIDREL